MKIPHSSRKKALIIVDVQPSFLNKENEYIVEAISAVLKGVPYDAYIETTFHTEKGSLWDIQQGWTCPKGEDTNTIAVLQNALIPHEPLQVHKETKSVFKGDKDIVHFLKEKGIEELHIVGLETNDCVLATAYEGFDFGFVTYMIEECSQSSSSTALHEQALNLLREQHMTNNSCIENIGFLEIN